MSLMVKWIYLMSSQVNMCPWITGLSGLAFPAPDECSRPPGHLALVRSELCTAPALLLCRLCIISLSDFSDCAPRSLSFFLFLLLFSGLHILPLVLQDMPPQLSRNSWPLAKLPHCGQLAPSGHLQFRKLREHDHH